MSRSPDHPFVVAVILGAIVGAMAAVMGGVRLRSEHVGPVSSDLPAPQEFWTLDLFGLPTIHGIANYYGGFAWALLAFTVVGVVLAIMVTAFVRRRLYGPG